MGNHFRSSRFNQAYLDRVVLAVRGAPAASAQGDSPPASGRARPAQTQPSTQYRSVLEIVHPEIANAITLLWGYPEMYAYFERLWLADATSRPIDPDAMSELMLLSRLHQSVVPERPRRNMSDLYGGSKAIDAATPVRDVWLDVPPRR